MNNLIREYRKKNGMTQKVLATKAGVRRESIIHLEKGRFTPSLTLAYKIARILGTSIEEIFIFDDDEM